MNSAETWQEWQARVDAQWLHIEALTAQLYGIDTTEPGWRDKYLRLLEWLEHDRAEKARLIATPHVDEAVEAMEVQFGSADGE